MMKKRKLKIFLHLLLLIAICLLFVGTIFMAKKYPETTFDELKFYIKTGAFSGDLGVYWHAIKLCLPFFIIFVIVLYAIFYDITFNRKKIMVFDKQIYPFKIINNHRKIFTIFLLILVMVFSVFKLGIYDYMKNSLIKSGFIAEHYVDPRDVKIEFNQKKNLIYIFVESLETSFFNKEQGGYWKDNVTPELYNLLNDNDSVSFYNKNKYQLIKSTFGTEWTTASIVANTSGVPFKIPIQGNSYHSNNFMNGAYNLGDLLYENGYYNEVISASTTSFGGLKDFFTKHGNYSIIDVDNLSDYGFKPQEKDLGGWGMNDNYLFEVAKKRLEEISKQNKPFNMELITIDTHSPEGYLGDYSIRKFSTNYENVYATESKLLYNFINWVKKQDYYKDTTIVIVGDHLNMLSEYFVDRGVEDRYVYGCIVNSSIKPIKQNDRTVTPLDFYPTVVAAIGGQIEGDKLSLGVNLFSEQKTLAEEYGNSVLYNELQKKSFFYDNYILDDENIYKLKLEGK